MIYGEYYNINVWICGQFGPCPRIHLKLFCRRAPKVLRDISHIDLSLFILSQGTLGPVAIPSSHMT